MTYFFKIKNLKPHYQTITNTNLDLYLNLHVTLFSELQILVTQLYLKRKKNLFGLKFSEEE